MLSDKVDQDDSLKSEEDPARQSFWWKQTLDQKNSSKKSEYWVLIELRFSQEMIDRACLLPPPEPSKTPLDRQTVSQTDRQSYRSVRLIYQSNARYPDWTKWEFSQEIFDKTCLLLLQLQNPPHYQRPCSALSPWKSWAGLAFGCFVVFKCPEKILLPGGAPIHALHAHSLLHQSHVLPHLITPLSPLS